MQQQPREKWTNGCFSRSLFYIYQNLLAQNNTEDNVKSLLGGTSASRKGDALHYSLLSAADDAGHLKTVMLRRKILVETQNENPSFHWPHTSDLEPKSSQSQMLTRTDKELSVYSPATGAPQHDNLPTQVALSQPATLEKCVILFCLYQPRPRGSLGLHPEETVKRHSSSTLCKQRACSPPWQPMVHWSFPRSIGGEQWDAHKEPDVYLQPGQREAFLSMLTGCQGSSNGEPEARHQQRSLFLSPDKYRLCRMHSL